MGLCPAAGIDAEHANNQDADLEKDEGGRSDDDHSPTGAEDIVR